MFLENINILVDVKCLESYLLTCTGVSDPISIYIDQSRDFYVPTNLFAYQPEYSLKMHHKNCVYFHLSRI